MVPTFPNIGLRGFHGEKFAQRVLGRGRGIGSIQQGSGFGSRGRKVRVWATFRDRRHAQGAPLEWKPATQMMADAVALDPGTPKQEILGFGAALTDASCYVLSRLAGPERHALLEELFAPGEMALNVCRTCIGASDYSRNAYTYDESAEPDPD